MAAGSPGLLARGYFWLKPCLPRRLRFALRKSLAHRIARKSRCSWPINEAAGDAPQGWQGWPGSKEFAFVLTHDVESSAGIGKALDLAKLEQSLGLRSSFNFIPEGTYEDPVFLREWLDAHNFEIGVHDLNHDGHLYSSKQGFEIKSKRINHYLGQWGAVGFRSAFMLRQLDWIHELDVLYDASTFDTDPFEPQPNGAHTIFPFLVKSESSGSGDGYVELPYTLPQDSTLFLLLGEQSIEVWKSKLEWIAKRGGLALINIHPDYIDFSGSGSPTTYPVNHVREFLQHLCDSYQGRFWNPLAREISAWFRKEGCKLQDSAEPAC